MNLDEYIYYDKKLNDNAVIVNDELMKNNTSDLKDFLEEKKLVEYIINELDKKRNEINNNFINIQNIKKRLISDWIEMICWLTAAILLTLRSTLSLLTGVIILLSCAGCVLQSIIIKKRKEEIKPLQKECTVLEAQNNLLIEKLHKSRERIKKMNIEDKNISSEENACKNIDMNNVKALSKKLEMYKYLIENEEIYKKYLNYIPLGNEYDHVFFTDDDINNIKSAKKKAKKR